MVIKMAKQDQGWLTKTRHEYLREKGAIRVTEGQEGSQALMNGPGVSKKGREWARKRTYLQRVPRDSDGSFSRFNPRLTPPVSTYTTRSVRIFALYFI